MSTRIELLEQAASCGYDINSLEFAQLLDSQDELRELRHDFFVPKMQDLPQADLSLVDGNSDCIYMLGNSLGLQPKRARQALDQHMHKWATMGCDGHFHGEDRWINFHETVVDKLCSIVGAKPIEVVIMNTATVNLHLMMVSFYRPTPERYKILIEDGAFPSDHYAVESQIQLHGYDPKSALLLLTPREGEYGLRTEDILNKINECGDSIALVMLPGVQFFTGQLFEMQEITKAAHSKGCMVGWDLCHAAGAVELKLHDWNLDFAVWCSYKYLNSGPGAIAAAFVHERHAYREDLKRLDGWFCHRLETRFEMTNLMDRAPGALGFQLSNPSIADIVKLFGSLEVFSKTSMSTIVKKSRKAILYLELLVRQCFDEDNSLAKGTKSTEQECASFVEIISPQDPSKRGSHLSFTFSRSIDLISKEFAKRGVVVDVRRNKIIRAAIAPLYNSYQDIYLFVKVLKDILG